MFDRLGRETGGQYVSRMIVDCHGAVSGETSWAKVVVHCGAASIQSNLISYL